MSQISTARHLPTVSFVDLARYAGRWYEIARYPNPFERNCAGVTADYSLHSDGEIRVVNTCRKFRLDGPLDVVTGRARIVDPGRNSKLKVRFFGPFEGDYWIIGLGINYEYAVVSAPDREFLWILNRTPRMDPKVLYTIIAGLPALGFDPTKLEFVTQYAVQ